MGRKKDCFWQYVDIVEENKLKCRFCGEKFAGGASRIKGHLSGIKRKGINVCRKVPKNVRIEAASTYDDYQRYTSSKFLGTSSFQIDYPPDVRIDSLEQNLVNLDSPSGTSKGYSEGYQLALNDLISEQFPIEDVANQPMEQEVLCMEKGKEQEIQKEEGSKGETEVLEEMNLDRIYISPGFRFHPTDEELLFFFLRKKIQQKSPLVEVIKELDIYKYEPWQLPGLAIMGETEWYFCCPIDHNYINNENLNRVTKNGYWKAIGIQRPIHSGRKCIGVKELFEYYKGSVSNGIITNWMMQEFRLLPASNSASLPTDSWAICKIFQKTNFLSMVEDVLPLISILSDKKIQSANDTIEKGSASSANLSAFDIPSDMPIDSTASTFFQTLTSSGDIADYFDSDIISSDLPQIGIEFEWQNQHFSD